MPIYEFECQECAHIAEILMAASERNNSILCERCGGKTDRIISAPSTPIIKSGGGLPGKEEDWNKSKTIGEYWDRQNVKATGKEAQEASKKRIEKMRKKHGKP